MSKREAAGTRPFSHNRKKICFFSGPFCSSAPQLVNACLPELNSSAVFADCCGAPCAATPFILSDSINLCCSGADQPLLSSTDIRTDGKNQVVIHILRLKDLM